MISDLDAEILGDDAEIMCRYWDPRPGDFCFDIGSGPGPWTIASALQGAFVVAFDPSPDSQAVLLEKVRKHRLTNVLIAPFALWDGHGERTFVCNNKVSNSPKTDADSVVAVTWLDGFIESLQNPSVDWINMDCEGAELRVLRGAKTTIQASLPTIIIEVHAGVDRQDLKTYLLGLDERYGFSDDGSFLIARV